MTRLTTPRLRDYLWIPIVLGGIVGGIYLSQRAQRETIYESDSWHTQSIEYAPASIAATFTGDMLPDKKRTPGAYYQEATLEKIKQPNYEKTIRHVTEADKKNICEIYGVPWEKREEYEFDHLVPASLGGTTDGNVWPQPRAGTWSAAVKDRLERETLRRVRSGELDLDTARKEIAENWISMYRSIFGDEPKAEKIEESEQ
jgi:hypothetical protein